MTNRWLEHGNDRYGKAEYVYSLQPNHYLKEQLPKFTRGKSLFPAEGEGRNAVFAAKLGGQVSAFDISVEGKKKVLKLAETENVIIDYKVGELSSWHYQPEQFDAIALIYAHFPADVKSFYHQMLDKFLRKGSIIIFEAFSKKHLDYISRNEKIGGPRNIASLFSIGEIQCDFTKYDFIGLKEEIIELIEGLYYNGTGVVIRFTACKK